MPPIDNKCPTCQLDIKSDFVYCNICDIGYHLNCCMLKEEPIEFICGTCVYQEDQFDRECICCEYHNGGIIELNNNFMHARCRYWSNMQKGACIVCLDGDVDHFVATCTACNTNSYHVPCALEKKLLPLVHPINLFQQPTFKFLCIDCKAVALSTESAIAFIA